MLKSFSTDINVDLLLDKIPEIYTGNKSTFRVVYILHRALNGDFYRHKQNADAFAISHNYLIEVLGIACPEAIREGMLSVFNEVESYAFGEGGSSCKGYSLSSNVMSLNSEGLLFLDEVRTYSIRDFKIKTVYTDGKNQISRYKAKKIAKEKGVDVSYLKKFFVEVSKVNNRNGGIAHSGEVVYSHSVKLNIDNLRQHIRPYIDKEDFHPVGPFLPYVARYDKGTLMDILYTVKSGRLFQVKFPHETSMAIQLLPKEERNILLKGFYEYDINNAVVTILSQFYKNNIGKDTPLMDDYSKNKQKYRDELVSIGFKPKQAKQFLLAAFYGASLDNLNPYYMAEWKQEIGYDNLTLAIESDMVGSLLNEFKEVSEEIMDWLYEQGSLVETSKEIIYTDELGQKAKFKKSKKGVMVAKVLSRLYMSTETKIMFEVLNHIDPAVLLFDCFIVPEQVDVKTIEQDIKEKLGYDIEFEESVVDY